MEILEKDDIISLAVKTKNKWAVYVANYLVFDYDYDTVAWDYIRDKCIELYPHNNGNIIVSLISGGLFFFDNETEMDEFFEIFNVRDITYAGGMDAATYNPDGECLTENT